MTEPMVSVRTFRRVLRIATVGALVIVLSVAFAVYLLVQQQREGAQQRQALREIVQRQHINDCGQAVHGTAGDLIFTDVLIEAAQSNGDQTAAEKRRTEVFRKAINERLIGALPDICLNVMTLDEYREAVDLEAHPPPDTGGVSLAAEADFGVVAVHPVNAPHPPHHHISVA